MVLATIITTPPIKEQLLAMFKIKFPAIKLVMEPKQILLQINVRTFNESAILILLRLHNTHTVIIDLHAAKLFHRNLNWYFTVLSNGNILIKFGRLQN